MSAHEKVLNSWIIYHSMEITSEITEWRKLSIEIKFIIILYISFKLTSSPVFEVNDDTILCLIHVVMNCPAFSPRRGSDVYSDRFIPSRAGSQLDNAMNLLSQAQETHPEGQVNSVMNNMIRSELLGHDFDGEMRNGLAPSQSRSANLFRYKSSEDSYGSGVSSNSSSPSASQYARAHSLPAMSPSARVSYDSPSSTSGRSRRKISRVPFFNIIIIIYFTSFCRYLTKYWMHLHSRTIFISIWSTGQILMC